MEQSPEEKAHNRQRMLEIRALVRKTIEAKGRMDKEIAFFDSADIKRVTIALQDMVDDAQTRHAKATKNIETIVEHAASIDKDRCEALNRKVDLINDMRRERVRGVNKLTAQQNELAAQAQLIQNTNIDVNNLTMENEKLQRQVETLLGTIAIMNEGMA